MKKYEIKTMQKDIEELKKKMGVRVLPGEPLPSEPVEAIKPVKPVKPKKEKKKKKKRKKINYRKIFVPIVSALIVLLIVVGVYLFLITEESEPEEEPKPEIPAFLIDAEIIESLEINIPANISDVLGQEYTFFLYTQEEGNRAGFVVKIIDREVILQDWEQTIIEDLEPLFLDQELGEPATEEFQDNIYKETDIRYLNFSDPALTIDYAVVGDYLIVTTSKESMYWVIDRLVEEPEKIIKDCGSVVNTHIFIESQNLTEQERGWLQCISEALLDCNLAKIEFLGEGGGEYQILGQENQDCVILQKSVQPESQKTCKIPVDFINSSKTAAEEQNQIDMLFVGTIPFIFIFEKVIDVQTNEVISFECE